MVGMGAHVMEEMDGGCVWVNKPIAIISISHGLQLQLLWCGDCCSLTFCCIRLQCCPPLYSILRVHVGGLEESSSL